MACTEGVGSKHDSGKQGWYSLPLEILEPLADVTEFGANKYELFNMLKPFDQSNKRFWNGLMRHLKLCQQDPLAVNHEDGNVYHLAQVAFNSLLRLHHAIQERGHAHDYLKPNKDETGIPGPGSDCADSDCPDFCTQGDLNNTQRAIQEFLTGFRIVPNESIHCAVLPEGGESATECDDESCSCHHKAGADGRDVEAGIPWQSESSRGWRSEPWRFSGAGETLGQGAKAPDVASAPKRKDLKRSAGVKRQPPFGRPEI
jgi:hypothetical protein